jgi:hypothetical protein
MWDQTCEGQSNPRSAVDRKPRADPRDRGSSGHDERNGRPSRASPIQMTGSGTPGEEAPMAHDPKMGNGPLNCSHARSLAPAVLKPYVRLASNKNQRCVSRARPATCSPATVSTPPTSIRSRSRPTDRGERGQITEPFSVRNPQGQRSPSTKTFPGPAKNARGRAKKPKRDSRVASWQS